MLSKNNFNVSIYVQQNKNKENVTHMQIQSSKEKTVSSKRGFTIFMSISSSYLLASSTPELLHF